MLNFKSFRTCALVIPALVCPTLGFSKDSGQSFLTAFAEALNHASSVKSHCVIQGVTAAPTQYTIVLAKPNLARIDSPESLTIADGTNITTYLKAKNEYYVVPEKDTNVGTLIPSSIAQIYSPFFDARALNPGPESRDLGQVTINSEQLEKVSIGNEASATSSTTLYLNTATNLVKMAEFLKGTDTSNTTILHMNSMTIGGSMSPSDFAFTPPTDSKQISIADMSAAAWYTDLGKAEQVAAATGRKVFVDFFATWCGPCKMLDAEVFDTDKFKALSKYFVFVKVDVDAQPSIASQYSITAMPTQMVLDDKGTVLDKIVGYGGPDMFYNFINKWATSGA